MALNKWVLCSILSIKLYNLFLQNTFQLVVATDGISSYVLFLYADLEWSKTDFRGGTSGSGDIINSGDISGSGDFISRLVWV